MVIDPSKGEKKDIIHFYNEVYIKVMKDYIIATKPGQSQKDGPTGNKTPVINSIGSITPGINKP